MGLFALILEYSDKKANVKETIDIWLKLDYDRDGLKIQLTTTLSMKW
jgi:hypothetical protein